MVGAGKTPEEARRNKLLRQAISIALDWEEQMLSLKKGRGRPLTAPCRRDFSAGVTTAPRLSILLSTQRGRTAASNAVRSKTLKKLMIEAGYPDGRDAETGRPLVLNFDWQGTSAGSKSFWIGLHGSLPRSAFSWKSVPPTTTASRIRWPKDQRRFTTGVACGLSGR